MNRIEIIGFIAGIFTTFSSLPQLIKIIKTKSAQDVSLGMFIFILTGVLLWIIYGILINSLPLVIWNIIIVVLSLTVIAFKLKYSKK